MQITPIQYLLLGPEVTNGLGPPTKITHFQQRSVTLEAGTPPARSYVYELRRLSNHTPFAASKANCEREN